MQARVNESSAGTSTILHLRLLRLQPGRQRLNTYSTSTGGSRGNPGPDGSGSVIIKVAQATHAASMIWVSSMAYGHKSTTNDMAEYWGLIHGLRGALQHQLTPLTVIGDSQMIINQNKGHRPPKKKRLRALYNKARRAADSIGVHYWIHHYRQHNKRADKVDNLAMGSANALQALATNQRTIFQDLIPLMAEDVRHWFTAFGPTSQALSHRHDLGPDVALLVSAYSTSSTGNPNFGSARARQPDIVATS